MTAKAPGLPTLGVTKENWYDIVEAIRKTTEDDQHTSLSSLVQYGICPVGLFTPLSTEMWNTYTACGGLSRLSQPADYYRLSALYVDAVRIIEGELKRIEDFKRDHGNPR